LGEVQSVDVVRNKRSNLAAPHILDSIFRALVLDHPRP
jgi:hypothetical protein